VSLCVLLLTFLSGAVTRRCPCNNREHKQRPRRRQRERQKGNRFRLAEKQLYTCITFFCTFLYRAARLQRAWNFLISRFIEDLNVRRLFSFSFCELRFSSLEFNSWKSGQHLTNVSINCLVLNKTDTYIPPQPRIWNPDTYTIFLAKFTPQTWRSFEFFWLYVQVTEVSEAKMYQKWIFLPQISSKQVVPPSFISWSFSKFYRFLWQTYPRISWELKEDDFFSSWKHIFKNIIWPEI